MTVKVLSPDDLVLVTGGAGYVGSHLLPFLLEKGFRVRVLENFLYGPGGLPEIAPHPRLEVCYGDVCNIRDMFRAAKGAKAVVALAALVGDGACELDHDETVAINIESTKLLCQVVKHEPGIQRLVFASSCSVYGATEGLVLNEGSRLNPVSFYARSRIVSEKILRRELDGRSFVILRLGTLFGGSKRPRFDLLVNTMTCRALNDGRIPVMGGAAWRPNLHVRDAARAFMIAAEASNERVSGEVFNVGSDENNETILGVAERVAARVPGTEVESVHAVGDLRSYRVSFSKIRHILDFAPEYSIESGVDEIRSQVEDGGLDWSDSRYSNLQHLKENGFAGEGPACLEELRACIGEVA